VTFHHPVFWHVREPPLVPTAVAARGSAAITLARRLLASTDDARAKLRGAAARDLMIVAGDAEVLPWVDGAVYLGQDLRAPALLLPTTRTPSVHPELLERALLRDRDPRARPLAILLDPLTVAPLGPALPLRREEIEAWLKDQEVPR
jgi:hypothetical protein